jgi:hypothetical protein
LLVSSNATFLFFLVTSLFLLAVQALCSHSLMSSFCDSKCARFKNYGTIKINTETLIDASKEVGLEVNAEKTKYMLLYRHQNAGQNHNIKIGDRSFQIFGNNQIKI